MHSFAFVDNSLLSGLFWSLLITIWFSWTDLHVLARDGKYSCTVADFYTWLDEAVTLSNQPKRPWLKF